MTELSSMNPFISSIKSYYEDANVTTRILFFLTCALVLIRLLFPGYTPFINDEPALQLRLDAFFDGSPYPRHGLFGSQPIPYGPVPTWIYSVVRFFTDDHIALVLFYSAIQVATLFGLGVFLSMLLPAHIAVWPWLLTASSPYLFFYSRVPWDNTFLFPISLGISASVWHICESVRNGVSAHARSWWTVLFLCGALAVGTHLMTLPIVGVAFAIAFSCALRSEERQVHFKAAMLGSLVFALVLAPYVHAILPFVLEGSASSQRPSLLSAAQNWFSALFRTTTSLTAAQFTNNFFSGSEEPFRQTLGIFAFLDSSKATMLLRAAPFAILAVLAYQLPKARQTLSHGSRTAVRIGLLFTAALVTFFALTGHYKFPHYYHLLWWLPAFLFGCMIHFSKSTLQNVTKAVIAIAVCMNVGYLIFAARFVALNKGTRGLGYGTVAFEQQRAVASICRRAHELGKTEVTVDISNVAILPYSLQYFRNREAECDKLAIGFGKDPKPDFCLQYPKDSPSSAELEVKNGLSC